MDRPAVFIEREPANPPPPIKAITAVDQGGGSRTIHVSEWTTGSDWVRIGSSPTGDNGVFLHAEQAEEFFRAGLEVCKQVANRHRYGYK